MGSFGRTKQRVESNFMTDVEQKEETGKRIITKNEFSLMVEERSANEGLTCLEVITLLVEETEVAIDSIPDLLSSRLITRIEAEARNLNLLKKVANGSIKSLIKNNGRTFTKKIFSAIHAISIS